jgi:hypothetical protein
VAVFSLTVRGYRGRALHAFRVRAQVRGEERRGARAAAAVPSADFLDGDVTPCVGPGARHRRLSYSPAWRP